MDSEAVPDAKKGIFANTLGYIYYYDFCGDGAPDYKEAFRYYSYGLHATGMFESAYKLADLYSSGKAGFKNPRAAYNLVRWAYDNSLTNFCAGGSDDIGNKLADAAVRLGDYYRDGAVGAEDPDSAYFYYTQAAFAIEQRAKAGGYIGDASVKARIENRLEELRDEFPYEPSSKWAKEMIPTNLLMAFDSKRVFEVHLKKKKKHVLFNVQHEHDDRKTDAPKILVTFPRHGYCRLHNVLSFEGRKCAYLKLKGKGRAFLKTGETSFRADSVRCVRINSDDCSSVLALEFSLAGKPVATIAAMKYRTRIDWEED